MPHLDRLGASARSTAASCAPPRSPRKAIRESGDKGEEVKKLREELDKLTDENRDAKGPPRQDRGEARVGQRLAERLNLRMLSASFREMAHLLGRGSVSGRCFVGYRLWTIDAQFIHGRFAVYQHPLNVGRASVVEQSAGGPHHGDI